MFYKNYVYPAKADVKFDKTYNIKTDGMYIRLSYREAIKMMEEYTINKNQAYKHIYDQLLEQMQKAGE